MWPLDGRTVRWKFGGQSVEISGVRSGGQKKGLIDGLIGGHNHGQRTQGRTVRPSKGQINAIPSTSRTIIRANS
jgi:hypothetical protein